MASPLRRITLLTAFLALFLAGCSTSPNVITWETASEVDTAGFNIYRGLGAEGPWEQINASLIPAAEDPVQGGKYSFTDEEAEPGTVYFYLLEEVELNGAVTRFPPIQLEKESWPSTWPLWALGAVVAVALGWWIGGRLQREPGA